MSFAAGQALAYLKVGALALAVILVIGVAVRVIEARGRRNDDGGDSRDGR